MWGLIGGIGTRHYPKWEKWRVFCLIFERKVAMTVLLVNIDLLRMWALSLLPWAGFFFLAMLLDMVGGIALALYDRTFSWEKLPRFLETGLLFFWAWMTIEVFAFAPTFFGVEPEGWLIIIADYGPKAIFGLIVAGKYGSSIVKKVREVLENIQQPSLDVGGDEAHVG